jgi:ribosomal protein S18 acetylase RimI-like enzyme
MRVLIRSATPADEEILRSLWDDSNHELEFTPYPQSEFAAELITDHIALVAEDDGAVIGTVYAAMPGEEHGFVFGLYVIPSARRRGIARSLMVAVTKELGDRSRRFVVLSVDSPNTSARALYERMGFVDQARILRADVQEILDHQG